MNKLLIILILFPTIAFASTLVNTNTITVYVNATDQISGIRGIQFKFNDDKYSDELPLTKEKFELDISKLNEGDNTLFAKIYDNANNYTVVSANFIKDLTSPDATISIDGIKIEIELK